MQRARVLALFACLVIASIASAPSTAATAPAAGPLLVFGHNLIRPKQQVSDDPLDGLPTDDGDQRGHSKGGGHRRTTCAVDGSPADYRDIGDLRAALAFVKHGPASWPCPVRAAQSETRLRMDIDGDGKITACEPIAGAPAVVGAMAKRLIGKSIARRPAGATTGIVVLTFRKSGL